MTEAQLKRTWREAKRARRDEAASAPKPQLSIRERRSALGISAATLAEIAQVSQATISKAENWGLNADKMAQINAVLDKLEAGEINLPEPRSILKAPPEKKPPTERPKIKASYLRKPDTVQTCPHCRQAYPYGYPDVDIANYTARRLICPRCRADVGRLE